VWAFQIGFVGAIMFGLVALLCSDHDGPIDRRDALGLLAGTASLMCSGVALVMVAVVGLASLVRRGPKVAAFYVLPLAALYGTWYVLTQPGGIENPYGRGANVRELRRFIWSGARGTVEAIVGARPLAFVLLAIVAGGLILIATQLRHEDRTRLSGPFALAAGALMFLVGTGYTRWFVTPTADSQSRYIYTLAALLLPALAVCADVLVVRWRLAVPVVLGVFLVGAIANVGRFGTRPPFDDSYQRQQRELMTAIAYSNDARAVPAYVRPNVWFTIGWLRTVAAAGDIPRPRSEPAALERRVHAILGVSQLEGAGAENACRRVPGAAKLRPRAGQRYAFRFANPPAVGASWFVQNTLIVTPMQEHDRPGTPLAFKRDFGHTVEIEFDDLTLQVRAADPHQTLILCRSEADLNDTG
jgi:hypothetical protein